MKTRAYIYIETTGLSRKYPVVSFCSAMWYTFTVLFTDSCGLDGNDSDKG
jgi:hypothetical protein